MGMKTDDFTFTPFTFWGQSHTTDRGAMYTQTFDTSKKSPCPREGGEDPTQTLSLL